MVDFAVGEGLDEEEDDKIVDFAVGEKFVDTCSMNIQGILHLTWHGMVQS